jgi:hypothetical protein
MVIAAAIVNPSRLGETIDSLDKRVLQPLPKELRLAIMEIVNPAYQELVLEAAAALARSAGTTLVHLLWLELLQQLELLTALRTGDRWTA